MIKEDGSPGTFDQGARGIMMPQLGVSSLPLASLKCLILDLGTAYLPSGRFYRVCLSLESPTAGSDIFPFTSMFCVSDFFRYTLRAMYLLSDTSQRSTTQIMVQKEAYTFPQELDTKNNN